MQTQRRGQWIQTAHGRKFYVSDPRCEDIFIDDIAHALSRQCRFGGHTWDFFSVAEHCWHVSFLVTKDLALWALLHDAAEAYLVDVPRPAKIAMRGYGMLRSVYDELEENILRCVAEKFSLSWPIPDEVKQADNLACRCEAHQVLMGGALSGWAGDPVMSYNVQYWSPDEGKERFLTRFKELDDDR